MKYIISFFLMVISHSLFANTSLPKFFSNHMVLQRDAPITIYGWADAGKTVTIHLDITYLVTTADANGEWSVTFPSRKAGGPFKMKIMEDNIISFDDVFIGDVWFCSGQSNMGWKLEDAFTGKEELLSAYFSQIKLLQVPRTMAGVVQKDIHSGKWESCSPKSVKQFSAVAYFFGKELYHSYNVPIGLINASWGGTNIEAWMSEEVMGKHSSAREVIAKMRNIDFSKVTGDYKKSFTEWEKLADKLDVGLQEKWFESSYSKSKWKKITLPAVWANAGISPTDGVVWVSKSFKLSQEDLSQEEMLLSIGRVDNEDVTYINGQIVGESRIKDLNRLYKIPKSKFVLGKNNIVIRVKNNGDIGGFRSAKETLYLETAEQKLSLAGAWQYEIGTKDIELVPERQHPSKYVTSLYNGMVAPFFGIRIKGIIWYQGEANAKNAPEYRGLFKELINNWRKNWKEDYPFIFAQLPNLADQNDNWVALRESQAAALELKHTGMAVLIDEGEDDNIHPTRKQIVGKRMATIAGNLAYGRKKRTSSAPVFEKFRVERNRIIVTFKNGKFKKETAKSGISGFMIAGKDKIFYPANANLKRDRETIILNSKKVLNPEAVRYLWVDAPGKIMLYGKNELVTPPFRTDKW